MGRNIKHEMRQSDAYYKAFGACGVTDADIEEIYAAFLHRDRADDLVMPSIEVIAAGLRSDLSRTGKFPKWVSNSMEEVNKPDWAAWLRSIRYEGAVADLE